MKKINYKSDFDFLLRLTDCKGDAIPFPDCDWDARFWASNKAKTYTASYKDGVYSNCFRTDDGGIHFVFDRHNLGLGTLKWEPHFEFPNGIYPDGIQDKYEPQPLDIELVPGRGDCPTQAEIEAILPVIKGEDGAPGAPGEKMTYADLTEEDKADLMAPFKETLTGKADRTELSNIVGEPTDEVFEDIEPGIIHDALRKTEQELTPEEQAQVKTNLGISKMELFCDLFNASAGNAGYARITNGEFDGELNKVKITYEEAVVIYANRQRPPYNVIAANVSSETNKLLKTNLWCRTIAGSVDNIINVRGIFSDVWRYAETLNIECGNYATRIGAMDAFLRCNSLKEIIGIFTLSDTLNAFNSCYALESFKMKITKTTNWKSVDFSDSPKISVESFVWMIENAENQIAITIYVHPSVYSKLNDETNTEWHAVLTAAAAKNINFATTA